MKNYKKHIDDFFREKLGKYRETPPADVWDDLSLRLDTLKPFVPGSSYRWLWHVGMASVIAVFSVSLVKKISKPVSETQHAVAENIAPVPTDAASALKTEAAEGASFDKVALPANAQATEEEIGKNDAAATKNNTSIPREEYTPSSGGGNKAGSKLSARNTAVNGIVMQATPGIHAAKTVEANQQSDNIYYNAAKVEPQGALVDARETSPESSVLKVKTPAKKEEQIVKKTKPVIKQKEQEVSKKKHNGLAFGFGVKAGYERGFNDAAATKYLIAPYVQLKLSSKLAILVQPAVKYAEMSNRTLNTQSYYKVTDTRTDVDVHSQAAISQIIYRSTYTYTAQYDSIVKVRSFGGSYTEFELPLMLQYNLAPALSVYGGVNVALTRMSGIKEQTYTTRKVRTADTVIDNPIEPYSGPAPDLSYKVHYSLGPYSDYTSPSYVNKQETSVRLGYMLGFSYEYSHRWLFDALVQQSPVKPDLKEGYNVNAPLSSTYFRLSVGYKLK